MDRYPLVSALSRPVIVKHLARVGRASTAPTTVAHGCTGKGNDQVRFEVGLAALAPDLEVLAPVRDSGMTRDKAIAFAEEKGMPIDVTQESPYSIDQNLWGRAVETGLLEDIWDAPHDDVYELHRTTRRAARARRARDRLRRRRAGRASTARRCTPLEIITELNAARRRARASAGSTWSRTGWSASRAGRSTRARARSR